MTVIIPHPTEELIFAKLQKEIISELFEDGRIMIAEKPLWIPVNTVIECSRSECIEITGVSENCGFDTASGLLNHREISFVDVGELEICEDSVFVEVTVKSDSGDFLSRLNLVRLHSGRQFSDSDRLKLAKIKQPVRQLKVFRLGLVQEEGLHAKSISKSVWCKLHHTRTTVE